jgi:hypothetical protein
LSSTSCRVSPEAGEFKKEIRRSAALIDVDDEGRAVFDDEG